MERECKTIVSDPRRGKNMFALGMLCNIYSLDMQLAADQVALTFGKKDRKVVETNIRRSRPAPPGRSRTSPSSTASRPHPRPSR